MRYSPLGTEHPVLLIGIIYGQIQFSLRDFYWYLYSKTIKTPLYFPAFGYGMVAIGLAFMAGSMGGVLQAAVAVTFAVAGPLFAAFTLAIFVPFTNAKVSHVRH